MRKKIDKLIEKKTFALLKGRNALAHMDNSELLTKVLIPAVNGNPILNKNTYFKTVIAEIHKKRSANKTPAIQSILHNLMTNQLILQA